MRFARKADSSFLVGGGQEVKTTFFEAIKGSEPSIQLAG
jgi:hypothetical protein